MLTRLQMLLLFKKRKNNDFSKLPVELIHVINEFSTGADSDIGKLLTHISNANLNEAKAILEVNPALLIERSTVKLPSGVTLKSVTPYECSLRTGDDPEMTEMIANYFVKIPGGETEKEKQEKRYEQCIVDMFAETPYDLSNLLKIIKESSADDIAAALKNDFNHESKLKHALAKFRNDITEIAKAKAFNFNHILNALDVYDREFNNLRQGDDYTKSDLYCRQIIGFMQRFLPARARQVCAYGLWDAVEQDKFKDVPRTTKFRSSNNEFNTPEADLTKSTGIGFDSFVGSSGRREVRTNRHGMAPGQNVGKPFLKIFFEKVQKTLLGLFKRSSNTKTPRR